LYQNSENLAQENNNNNKKLKKKKKNRRKPKGGKMEIWNGLNGRTELD